MDRELLIFRDEHGSLTVSCPNVHANRGDDLVFYAANLTAHVDLSPTGKKWDPMEFDVGASDEGRVTVPQIPKGAYRYSITSNGDRARGSSDPKIIIPR